MFTGNRSNHLTWGRSAQIKSKQKMMASKVLRLASVAQITTIPLAPTRKAIERMKPEKRLPPTAMDWKPANGNDYHNYSPSKGPDPNDPLTYYVWRSKTKNLPVYTDIKGAGTKNVAILRKLEGDLKALAGDLSRDLEISPAHILVKPHKGEIEFNGVVRRKIIRWLLDKGF